METVIAEARNPSCLPSKGYRDDWCRFRTDTKTDGLGMHVLRARASKFFALAFWFSFFVAPKACQGTLAIVRSTTESILPRAHQHATPSMGGLTVPFHVVLRVPCFSSITALAPSFLPLSRAFSPAHRPCVFAHTWTVHVFRHLVHGVVASSISRSPRPTRSACPVLPWVRPRHVLGSNPEQ